MEEQLQVEQVNNQDTKTSSYNVKPRLLARILGPLVDIFLLFLVTFAGFQLEMATPISNDYHHLQDELIAIVDDTKLETEFGYKYYDSEENYEAYKALYKTYLEEDSASQNYEHYYVVLNKEDASNEVKTAYQNSIKNNATYQDKYLTYKAINYGLLMLSAGVSELVFFLVIPLLNKRRATIGRFVAMTSLISTKEVNAKWWQILIRFLFILLVETALPLFYLSEIFTLIVVGGINLLITLVSRNSYRTLRDYISSTKIIDKNSFKTINEQ